MFISRSFIYVLRLFQMVSWSWNLLASQRFEFCCPPGCVGIGVDVKCIRDISEDLSTADG